MLEVDVELVFVCHECSHIKSPLNGDKVCSPYMAISPAPRVNQKFTLFNFDSV